MTFNRYASVPRLLQQQPQRNCNRQQQQSSGAGEFQPKPHAQMGEGSQEGMRDYGRDDRLSTEKSGSSRAGLANRESGRPGPATPVRKPEEQAR